jgi:hypothetical protein
VLNKVNAFITNPLLRAIIGQTTSSFDFRWLMDSGKILLCDLSKGGLGEDVSALLGSLIMTKLSLAALSRQDVPENDRRIHVLYADEVQNFVRGVKLSTILSEARKYRLALTIATQTINQLPEESIDAVFGNCATVMSFRVGGEDAETLKREFAMILPATHLQELPDYKAYVRTMNEDPAGGPSRPSGPYILNTFPPFSTDQATKEKLHVVRASLRRYARPRREVEARLNRFLASRGRQEGRNLPARKMLSRPS